MYFTINLTLNVNINHILLKKIPTLISVVCILLLLLEKLGCG
jgi:hypothetical protein